jgi:heme-degrading monooxygenase HmoA
VKAFPVLTDEGMPGDLSVSRTQGVTDPEKYTLIIGWR